MFMREIRQGGDFKHSYDRLQGHQAKNDFRAHWAKMKLQAHWDQKSEYVDPSESESFDQSDFEVQYVSQSDFESQLLNLSNQKVLFLRGGI
jgi:hypothetical protein